MRKRGRPRQQLYLRDPRVKKLFEDYPYLSGKKATRVLRTYGLTQDMTDLAFQVMVNDIVRERYDR